jgi:hypothetical protein
MGYSEFRSIEWENAKAPAEGGGRSLELLLGTTLGSAIVIALAAVVLLVGRIALLLLLLRLLLPAGRFALLTLVVAAFGGLVVLTHGFPPVGARG